MEKEDVLSVVEDIEDRKDHPVKFEEYVERLDESSSSYSTETVVNYIRYLEKIDFDPLSSNPCPEIYKEGQDFDLSEFMEYAEEKAKRRDFNSSNSKTRFKYFLYIALRSYLQTLNKDEKLDQLPPSRKIPKSSSSSPTQAPEQKHLKKLLGEEEDEHYAMAYRLLFYGGHRLSEVLKMKTDWISFNEEFIKIRIPPHIAKGSKQDVEPEHTFLPLEMKDDLKDFIKQRYSWEGDFDEFWEQIRKGEKEAKLLLELVEEENFRNIHKAKQEFNRHLQKTAEKADIHWADEFTSHRFRKGFVHRMKKQYGLSDAKELARHESPETTQNHYLKAELEEKGSKIEDAWS